MSDKINRRSLAQLLLRQGSKCNWCRQPIRQTHGKAVHVRHGIARDEHGEFMIATIDHVIPRGLGGLDHFANMVAACAICNGERDKRDMNINAQRICKKCKGPRPSHGWPFRSCPKCRADNKARKRVYRDVNAYLMNGENINGGVESK